MTKYIFVSGGVLSGLGKGITTASIGKLLQAKGYRLTAVKIDMYLNLDAGTIRPQEHGEVFVTDDGIETDQDIGHYERFLSASLSRANYITTGQVYQEVIRKERAFEYNGEDVEAIPHLSDEIIRRIELAGKTNEADIVVIELGGTVGEYQNAIFFEASRIMKLKNPDDILHIHLAYLPIPHNLGEMKSKPVQQSVKLLNEMGIQPDFVIGRAELPVDVKRRERIALFCNMREEDVLSNPDVDSIYEVPLVLEDQDFSEKILRKLKLPSKKKDLKEWRNLNLTIKLVKKEIKIGLVGKYFSTGNFMLEDVYVSVIEALKHAAWAENLKPVLTWIDSVEFEKDPEEVKILKNFDGVAVPGGFGERGVDGILRAIKYVREKKIPYLGLCYGMQLATVEFARNVAGFTAAHTAEINPKTPHPVIHIMPEQEKLIEGKNYGGTMRLGAYNCRIRPGTISHEVYSRDLHSVSHSIIVSERHRHRYEFNNTYRNKLEKEGLIIAGTSPNNKLVEIIELDRNIHPFFLGTQFHPEFKSNPLRPHPLFREFVRVAKR